MKKLLKYGIIAIVAIAVVVGIVSSFTEEKSETGVQSIQINEDTVSYENSVNLDLNDAENSKAKVSVFVKAGDDFSADTLQFVSANSSIATAAFASSETNSDSSYNYIVYFEITGVVAGETTVYVKTTDDVIQSDEITVRVTGDSAYPQLEALSGKPLYEAMQKMEELNYTATYYHADSRQEYNETIAAFTDDELQNKWVIVECEDIDTEKKTLDLYINTKENIAENEKQTQMAEVLSEKLNAVTAWQAVKAYGEREYIYGFDLHYIMGVLAEKAVDEDTWFLKAKVTVTNEYNADAELTCEAYVTGTDANPKIVDFTVY